MTVRKTILLCVVTSLLTTAIVSSLFLGIAHGTGLLANPSGGVPKLINYQGHLTDAGGQPVTNKTYSIEFRIYDVSTGGTPLWSETQTVAVSGGLFNASLGGTNPLSTTFFAGNTYLEVVVEGEVLSPRQPITSTAYAINAGDVYGQEIHPTNIATRSELGDPGTINKAGNPVNWTKLNSVPAGFADGVDNDTLATLSPAAGQVPKWTAAGTWAPADDLVATGGTCNCDDQYVNVDGDTMNGDLTVNANIFAGTAQVSRVDYTTPRTHYYSIPVTGFIHTTYLSTQLGFAGAYLPDGAIITQFKVFCIDTSANNLEAKLYSNDLVTNLSSILATVNSVGISGYGGNSIDCNHTVQNNAYSYFIEVSRPADVVGSLELRGVQITYTLASAP